MLLANLFPFQVFLFLYREVLVYGMSRDLVYPYFENLQDKIKTQGTYKEGFLFVGCDGFCLRFWPVRVFERLLNSRFVMFQVLKILNTQASTVHSARSEHL